MYEEVVHAGFFQHSPESTRRTYTWRGAVGALLAAIVSLFALVVLTPSTEAAPFIPFGLTAVGVGAFIFGRVMPNKTTKGSDAAARWRARDDYIGSWGGSAWGQWSP